MADAGTLLVMRSRIYASTVEYEDGCRYFFVTIHPEERSVLFHKTNNGLVQVNSSIHQHHIELHQG